MNSGRITRFILKWMSVIVVIAGCVYAGRVEYADSILSGMSLKKYQYIHDRIAPASQYEVAKEYMKHQEYYDSKNH